MNFLAILLFTLLTSTRSLTLLNRRDTLLIHTLAAGTSCVTGVAVADDTVPISSEDVRTSLVPATPEQPQIPLTGSKTAPKFLEGALYYLNPDRRPLATDTLLIRVRPTQKSSKENTVIAAARVPMAKIMVPFRFRLGESNAIGISRIEWIESLQEDDLLVEAIICSESETENQGSKTTLAGCPIGMQQDEAFQAVGIAKLLRLPDGTVVRAPVSLRI